MQTILFYGDSNTWGYNPDTDDRYPPQIRFTGRLASMLPDCQIIEGGMNGRTTAYQDPLEPWRNGAAHLPVFLKTFDPLDLVVLMLGVNDLKRRYRLSADEVVKGMQQLITIVQTPAIWRGRSRPRVLVIAQPPLNGQTLAGSQNEQFDQHSVACSVRLAAKFEALCTQNACCFLDAGQLGPITSSDGVHLSPENHASLATALAQILPAILSV